MKEKAMASDQQHEDVPQNDDKVPDATKDEATQTQDAPTGFPGRWSGGPDDSAAVAEGFGEKWSGDPDASTEKGEEFGERWSGVPDDSPERTEGFGTTWAGDNEKQPKS
jgi:hypothetical protein